jgi:opacity protein-like surface antigen
LNATINAKVDVKMQLLITEFGVDYELLKLPLGREKKSALRFDLRAGGRYVYMKGEVEVSAQIAGTIVTPQNVIPFSGGLAADSGGRRQWIEPLVGGAVWWDVNDRLRLMVRGDIGGFGVGSDLSWQVVGGVEWDVRDWFAIFAGYRLLDIDFVDGSGPRRFAFDVQMQGPYLAAMFRF